jgi:hypothetical protein
MTPSELAGSFLRVDSASGHVEGACVGVAASGVEIAQGAVTALTMWSDIVRISVRRGRPRSFEVPVSLGVVGALLFGTCGGVLDSLDRSTSGRTEPAHPLLWTLAAIGLFIGVVPGLLFVFARSAPHWEMIYEQLDATLRGGDRSLEERWDAGRPAGPTAHERRLQESLLAWILLVAFAILGWIGLKGYLRH